MKTYKFMLPCHTAEMKNKIIKQVLITIIFLWVQVHYKQAWM